MALTPFHLITKSKENCANMAGMAPLCVKQTIQQCDRNMVLTAFKRIEKKVNDAVKSIHDVINRNQAVKHYPYPTTYKMTLTKYDLDKNEDDVTEATSSLPCQANEHRRTDKRQPKETYSSINQRIMNTINSLTFEKERENVEVIAMIIYACYQYQTAVKNLVKLKHYLVNSFHQFSNLHIKYDNLLKTLQCDPNDRAEQDEAALPALTPSNLPDIEQLEEVQNDLDSSKDILLNFLNQVPKQVAHLNVEMQYMNLYDGVDDSPTIRQFINEQYVQSVIAHSDLPELKKVKRALYSSWQQLLPIEMVNKESAHNVTNPR